MAKTFEDIKAWQLSRKFRKNIFEIIKTFPKHELFVLVPQMRRAVISISSNIAEGFGRYSYQENIQFCRISRGSLNEILDQLYIALDEKYMAEDSFNNLYREGRELEKSLNGYIFFLKNQKSTI